jgi:hypothetical protein
MLSIESNLERMHFIDHLVLTTTNSLLIMNCILGVVAVHLAQCKGHIRPLDTVASIYYRSAICDLQNLLTTKAMSKKLEKQDETLLAILLLLFYKIGSHYLPLFLNSILAN